MSNKSISTPPARIPPGTPEETLTAILGTLGYGDPQKDAIRLSQEAAGAKYLALFASSFVAPLDQREQIINAFGELRDRFEVIEQHTIGPVGIYSEVADAIDGGVVMIKTHPRKTPVARGSSTPLTHGGVGYDRGQGVHAASHT